MKEISHLSHGVVELRGVSKPQLFQVLDLKTSVTATRDFSTGYASCVNFLALSGKLGGAA